MHSCFRHGVNIIINMAASSNDSSTNSIFGADYPARMDKLSKDLRHMELTMYEEGRGQPIMRDDNWAMELPRGVKQA